MINFVFYVSGHFTFCYCKKAFLLSWHKLVS